MAIPNRIKVLVSHDDPLWQAGAIATLGRHGDLELLEADHAPDGRIAEADADVVVTDYRRGVGLATATVGPIGRRHGPRIVVVTTTDRECEIRAALARGVQGYLLVGCASDELAAAVRAVHRGERTLCLKVVTRLADNLAFDPLTSREEDVLRLLVEGLCNKSIADRLDIEVGTVKSHLRALFGKLQVSSRTQAVALAQRRGLLGSANPPSLRESRPNWPALAGWAHRRNDLAGQWSLPST
jgi:DNA-binding NarL/FixJ family response regulator